PTCLGSSGSSALGLPFPTAQKPQWRVQISPRIMNVAVPSPQHSNMFGHRASWQTVCRFRPAIIRLTRSKPLPALIRTFNQSGRAPAFFGLAISRSPNHPPSNRPFSPRAAFPRHSASENEPAFITPCVYNQPSSEMSIARPKTSPNRAATEQATSFRSTWQPSSRDIDVTPLSAIPQGTIISKYSRLVFTLRANPWLVIQRAILTPIAATFSFSIQTPVSPLILDPAIPKSLSVRINTSSRSRT